MEKPQIATILESGVYGQREMTEEEIADYIALTASASNSETVTGSASSGDEYLGQSLEDPLDQ
jgi:hypothetical protein